MNATNASAAASVTPFVLRFARELYAREQTLALYGLALLLLTIPGAIALGIDERVLRGVNVWIKPIKFAVSIGLLALTTAWFIGYLPAARRGSRAVKAIVALLIATGTFEVGYIALQAGLGEASHYNESNLLHHALYLLMGIAALVLTATQPMLAWQLYRHGDTRHAPAFRLSVILGLTLTFVLGTGVGILLGAIQPPTGPHVPVFGWSTVAGDLRPAHFFGIHAEQALPLSALAILAMRLPQPHRWVWGFAVGYSVLCVALAAQALGGRPFIAL